MSYLVIARKYRPLKFEDVIGQEHVTKTLINAINLNKVHHAYIFTGPRGVGKTTISRILAKTLNCLTGITATPCGVCANCIEIDNGNSIDVREIDGASNRGIDEIRNLRDEIKFAPSSCRKKIYIIDEVHMLTNQAFNALLKTLEEPPPHALFIFATTEINEVPATILSRCQRHDFKRVPLDILMSCLGDICGKEGVSIDNESLMMIARSGDGSVRDSQSVLDQVIAYSGLEINSEKTAQSLGIAGQEKYFEFFNLILAKDQKAIFYYIETLIQSGQHLFAYLKGLLEFVRNLLILQSTNDNSLIALTENNIISLKKYIGQYSQTDLLLFLDLISAGISKIKNSAFVRIDFEIIMLKIFTYTKTASINELITKLDAVSSDTEDEGLAAITEEIWSRIKERTPLIANQNVVQQVEIVKPEVVLQVQAQEVVETKIVATIEVVEVEPVAQVDLEADTEVNIEPETQVNIEMPSEADVVSETQAGVEEEVVVESVQEITPELEQDEVPAELYSELYQEQKTEEATLEPSIESTETLPSGLTIEFVDKSTPKESSITIEEIRKDWATILKLINSHIPSLGNMLNYAVPTSFSEQLLTVKFDQKHLSFKRLADFKVKDIAEQLNHFYSKSNLSIRFIEESVLENERIIKVKNEEFMSEDELKEQLLKESPQLDFLFEKPFSCRIIK